MFNIEISAETADALVRDILIEDYRVVRNLHKRLEDKLDAGNDLSSVELEDKLAYERTIQGFECMLDYYLDHETYLVTIGRDGG